MRFELVGGVVKHLLLCERLKAYLALKVGA